jgi:DNA helicase-2/ATP-dependent DNA helicase PcrA
VPAIELVYGLVHYLKELHDDPEGQVYLEAFTRQLGACEQVSGFKGALIHDPSNTELSEKSVRDLVRDFLGPIASDMVEVDEDLIGSFPRDRLSVLSIHQSKGLEFPLTIVDVSSDYNRNHPASAFKRFPSDGGPPHRMEDLMRAHSALGKDARSQADRAFDDLIRQYFVAYSRPQEVLLLVGLDRGSPGGNIPNVAAGWTRDGISRWADRKSMPILKI